MASVLKQIKWLYNEFGLASLYHTGRDAWLVVLARSCRMFAFGAASLIIAVFFAELEFSDFKIGLFMSLTLVGDVLLSLGLTMVADGLGRRRILVIGAAMMMVSGAMFSYFENFWILLFAAVVGVISASGGDFGPFRSIEESILSHITTFKTRSDVLSWYGATSSLGSALGTELSGRIVDFFSNLEGWGSKDAYHAIFSLYVAMGLISLLCAVIMSDKCELAAEPAEPTEPPKTEASETLLSKSGEGEDDADAAGPATHPPTSARAKSSSFVSKFAVISAPTRTVMYKLWFLLSVDSMADGMVSYSLTNYYMDRKFNVSKSTLGDIISISLFLVVPSTLFAGPLAKRIGLINTMVYTHVPSSAAVLFFPVGHSLALTIILLFVRTAMNNMDQAPRTAFIAAVVKPEERTAVMGITGTLRTLAATLGPTITGSLAQSDNFWIAYVLAGVLRLAYDFGLYALFVNMKVGDGESEENQPKPLPQEEYESFELSSLEDGRSSGESSSAGKI